MRDVKLKGKILNYQEFCNEVHETARDFGITQTLIILMFPSIYCIVCKYADHQSYSSSKWLMSNLKRCDDTSFGNRDALLFHGLVDTGPVRVIHLDKLRPKF